MRALTRVTLILLVSFAMIAGINHAASKGQSLVRAEILSVDAEAGTITFKNGEEGPQTTLPVEAAAMEAMDWLQSGDEVTLTCRRSDDGKLLAVTAIAKG